MAASHNITPPERVLPFVWCFIAREFEEPLREGKQMKIVHPDNLCAYPPKGEVASDAYRKGGAIGRVSENSAGPLDMDSHHSRKIFS